MANPPSVMVPATRRAVVLWVGAIGLMAVLVAAVLLRAAWYSRSIAVTDIEHVHGLAVDPQDPRVLWIGTHAGLVRVVEGREWTRVGRARYDMMGFTIVPGPRPIMLTSGHGGPTDRRPEPLGLEWSRNGGRTWQTMALAAEADFHALAGPAAGGGTSWVILGLETSMILRCHLGTRRSCSQERHAAFR